MSTEVSAILLENLKETLKQFEKYLFLGLLAALSYFLIVISNSPTASLNLQGIVSASGVDRETVSIIWISIFWGLGALASYALERIDRICEKYLEFDIDKIAAAKEVLAKIKAQGQAISEKEEQEYAAVTESINAQHLRLEILKAAATYPSITTEVYPVIRISPAVISIVLIILARIQIWNSNVRNDTQVIELFFLVIPYIVIILLLLRGSLPIEKPKKYKAVRR